MQNFTRFSRNCFNSEKKYFALSRPSVPSSQLEKSPSQLKTGTEVGYRTMEEISPCQKPLISRCQKSLFLIVKNFLFLVVKNILFADKFAILEAPATGVSSWKISESKLLFASGSQLCNGNQPLGGRVGVKQGGERENCCRQGGLVRYVDLNGGKTGGLEIVCTDLKFEDSENYLLIKV